MELHVQGRTIACSYPVSCYAPSICSMGRCGPTPFPAYEFPISQPIVIAGIDPQAEAALARLDTCVVSGRYLGADDRIAISPATSTTPALPSIPVLASARSFVDDSFAVDVARAGDAIPVLAGTSPQQLTDWRQEASRTTAMDYLYRSYLPSVDGSLDTWPIWTVGDVSYQPVAGPPRRRDDRAKLDTPGPVAEARLSRIATDVHDATGLQVDIVKGSSLQPVEVDLPAGTFGRPHSPCARAGR